MPATQRAAEVAVLVERGLSVAEAHAALDKVEPPTSLDAVLAMLPPGADWRRFTPISMSLYAASPYGGPAQVRYDGYGPTAAAQLHDALGKMQAAIAKKRGGK